MSSTLSPGSRLVVAIAPELTIGLVLPSSLRSTAASESNGNPVPFTPILCHTSSGPSRSHARANTNGLATLMIVKSTSQSPAAYMLPLMPMTQMPKSSGATCASAG